MTADLYDRAYDEHGYQAETAYVPPAVRIVATYPVNIVGCPECVTVELNDRAASTLGLDIRQAVHALASVGGTALSLYGK